MKQVLVSVIVAVVVVPILAARDRSPLRGARRMVLALLVFNLLYVAWITLVHANLPPPPVR